jgi:acetolactate synthase I/II/III large subunit
VSKTEIMADGTNCQDGGEALLEAFRALGVEYVICASGSEWAPAWEAFARQRKTGTAGPRYIDVWHETVAVDLAIGFTLATGRMQAVLLHAAPGLLQGACGIHAANLAGLPLLVLSSDSNSYGERTSADPGSQWYRNLSTVGGTQGLVDHIVKWTSQIPGVETLYEFVKRAGEISQRFPRAPVYLNAPVEVLLERWDRPARMLPVAPSGRKISPDAEVEALVARLRVAKEPVILTESAGRDPHAFDALIRFAETFAVPVVESQGTICGNFPKSHPLYRGDDIGSLRDTADLILLINCRAPWYPPSNRPPRAATIVIDEVPQRPAAVHQVLFAELYLEGEVASTLERAAALGPSDPAAVAVRAKRHAGFHLEYCARIARAEAEASKNATLTAIPTLVALRAAVGDEAIYVDETITHSRVIQRHLTWDSAQRYYYVQGGLGQGIGVALGIKLARPDKFVTLLIGDGSFLYNPIVPALAASRDQKLPILIVIMNNRKYLSMQLNHLRSYPDGIAKSENDFRGVSLQTQPALEAFGTPFSMYCAEARDLDALTKAFAEGVAQVRSGCAAIINVQVDK